MFEKYISYSGMDYKEWLLLEGFKKQKDGTFYVEKETPVGTFICYVDDEAFRCVLCGECFGIRHQIERNNQFERYLEVLGELRARILKRGNCPV